MSEVDNLEWQAKHVEILHFGFSFAAVEVAVWETYMAIPQISCKGGLLHLVVISSRDNFLAIRAQEDSLVMVSRDHNHCYEAPPTCSNCAT
jgi:hypothetical protein